MSLRNHPYKYAETRLARTFAAGTLLPCALALSSIACSDRSDISSGALDSTATLGHKSDKKPRPKPLPTHNPSQPWGDVQAPCSDPKLGTPVNQGLVVATGQWVDFCENGGDCSRGPDATQIGLDYGNFPFTGPNGLVNGSYFFAVIAPGYENGGFLDGAPGNLSDTTASAAPGDRGSGDMQADRTIMNDGTPPPWQPKSSGTHDLSFPPSGFAVIQLVPFDETPDSRYELAVCPTGASSRCQCAFEAFTVRPHEIDGGTSGAGGSGESGGTTGTGGALGAGGTTGNGGAPCDAGIAPAPHPAGGSGGAPCLDAGAGGTTHGAGGMTHGAGGSGGAPCVAGSTGSAG